MKDPELLEVMHRAYKGQPCAAKCGKVGTALHHVRYRSHSGDDVAENLRWLCIRCHMALHGNPWADEMGSRWDAKRVRTALGIEHPT